MSLKANPDSLLGHLVELRNRLLRCVVAVILVFAALAAFAQDIYHQLAKPLMAVLPGHSLYPVAGMAIYSPRFI